MLVRRMKWKPALFTGTNEDLQNPWRGYYRLARYQLTDGADCSDEAVLTALDPTEPLTRLVLLEINLNHYRNCPLSEESLDQLQAVFSCYRRNSLQVIVRFLYDWDGRGLEKEPDRLDTVLTHMEQTGPVLLENEDIILELQGLFVGSWGEMHSSKFLSAKHVRTLYEKYREVTNDHLFLSVRSPAFLRMVSEKNRPFPPRLGIYNDGMFGSESDLGTFVIPGLDERKSREADMALLKDLNLLVPYGGEVLAGSSRGTYPSVLYEFRMARVTYLNRDYDPNRLNEWKQTIVPSGMPFAGVSVYAALGAQLGYRYQIVSARRRRNKLIVTIENTGFAPAYKPFALSVCWTDEDGRTTLQESSPEEYDVRSWTGTVKCEFPLPVSEAGTLKAVLKLVDPVLNEEIRCANRDGGFLGTLRIK